MFVFIGVLKNYPQVFFNQRKRLAGASRGFINFKLIQDKNLKMKCSAFLAFSNFQISTFSNCIRNLFPNPISSSIQLTRDFWQRDNRTSLSEYKASLWKTARVR